MEYTLARFAPAKINLFLEVAGRRSDGFHDITTIMETIAVGDTVEASRSGELTVETNRADVPAGLGNVAYTIVRAAEEFLGRPLPARIVITKNVPPGSGLGAGSSDAVAALRLVLDLHRVAIDRTRLAMIAASVGSDTAFFVDGGLAHCTGRGEIVQPLRQAGVRHVVLVLAATACATPAVYAALDQTAERAPLREPDRIISALARGETLIGSDADLIFNRLAAAAERVYPELVARRAHLTALAGRSPHLSGSGGSFFFLCPSQGDARRLATSLRERDGGLEVCETASYR